MKSRKVAEDDHMTDALRLASPAPQWRRPPRSRPIADSLPPVS
ncbi:hypothetical protein [Nonomuraea dietziae]